MYHGDVINKIIILPSFSKFPDLPLLLVYSSTANLTQLSLTLPSLFHAGLSILGRARLVSHCLLTSLNVAISTHYVPWVHFDTNHCL